MASDLDETQDRITWCGNRSLTLSAQIDQFISSGAYHISHEVDADSGDGTFYVQLVKKIPSDFRIEAGSIVHELRATLDNLACVLAIRNGKSAQNTYFPISRSLAIFEDDGIKRKLRNLSDADRETIATFKPYDGGNQLLFSLHACDLVRKHQRLIASSSGIKRFALGEARITSLALLGASTITEKRQPFARVGKGSYIDLSVGIDLSLSEPEFIRGRPVSTVLSDFTRHVQAIVGIFT
ncbi:MULTISPECIES: hypothetical protein [unclassified Mesorhizobium]|uniref:hypothetical protein n=1 Tax=unclassified Mesorhizobium TaxID=325217 RepID=UPI0003CF75EE|nr:hypothetical protein [Mesorhizobium sp. LSJC264A00]ESX23899.1 hypothetical protein X767_13680 [Mesorhizobium sp. LSJC264A00]